MSLTETENGRISLTELFVEYSCTIARVGTCGALKRKDTSEHVEGTSILRTHWYSFPTAVSPILSTLSRNQFRLDIVSRRYRPQRNQIYRFSSFSNVS